MCRECGLPECEHLVLGAALGHAVHPGPLLRAPGGGEAAQRHQLLAATRPVQTRVGREHVAPRRHVPAARGHARHAVRHRGVSGPAPAAAAGSLGQGPAVAGRGPQRGGGHHRARGQLQRGVCTVALGRLVQQNVIKAAPVS